MRFFSTKDRSRLVSFREATLAGPAADGGLFVPERVPPVGADELELLAAFAGEELARDELAALLTDALDFPLPLVEPRPGRFVLELFHGPTLAFKDLGARVLARLFARFAPGRTTVLVATSGDTGGAVASAFAELPGFEVALLYPAGRVSPLQEAQLASAGARAFAVAGSFDDCQRMVRAAFADPELARARRLASANSINVARWLPQTLFYARAARALGAAPRFAVPSGNLGNLSAGLLAARLGVPARGFLGATNRNDALVRWLTGEAPAGAAVATPSNAMDVALPSNLARLEWLLPDAPSRRRALEAHAVDDDTTLATIRRVADETGYLLDPHTAVGWAALDARPGSGPEVLLATAHPAKFPEVIERATGRPPALPERLAACLARPRRATRIPARFESLREALLAP